MTIMFAIDESIPVSKFKFAQFADAASRTLPLFAIDRSKILGNSRFEIRISR